MLQWRQMSRAIGCCVCQCDQTDTGQDGSDRASSLSEEGQGC